MHVMFQTKEKLSGRLGRPAEVHTEDEFYVVSTLLLFLTWCTSFVHLL